MVNQTHALKDRVLTLTRVKKQRRRNGSRLLKDFKSRTPWRKGEVQSQVGSLCIAYLDIRRSTSSFSLYPSMSRDCADWANCQSGGWSILQSQKYVLLLHQRQYWLSFFPGLVFPEAENRYALMIQCTSSKERCWLRWSQVMGRRFDTRGIRGKQGQDHITQSRELCRQRKLDPLDM